MSLASDPENLQRRPFLRLGEVAVADHSLHSGRIGKTTRSIAARLSVRADVAPLNYAVWSWNFQPMIPAGQSGIQSAGRAEQNGSPGNLLIYKIAKGDWGRGWRGPRLYQPGRCRI